MRDEHQCCAGGTGGLEQGGDDLLAGAAVQIACRLVRQQDLRACRDGTGNGNTLLLAARHLVRQVRLAMTKPDGVERGGGHIIGVAPSGELQRNSHILKRRH